MKTAIQKGLFVVCLVSAFLALGLPVGAQEAGGGEKVDPKAQELMQKVSAFYGGLSTVRVEATLTVKDTAGGAPEDQLSNAFAIAMRRPKQFSFSAQGDAVERMAVSDGETLYTLDPKEKKYTVQPAPDALAPVLSRLGSGIVGIGTLIMAELFRDKPYEVPMANVDEQRYLGEEEMNGLKCHHVKYLHPGLDWEMWIDAGDTPLVSKVVVDLAKVLNNGRAGKMQVALEITYKNWMVNGELPAATFTFTPPEGAEKVDSLEPVSEQAAGPEALRGKPAPSFTLDLLGGGKLDLAEHKGKHIVILDFWASWCGPCRQAMPIYVKVADEYKDKGVVFYGVNLRETPEVARAFLEKTKIQCAVALDTEGDVATQYAVAGIPTSVIIGKDGTVQAVHVGVPPGLEATLRKELDGLVAGKSATE